MVNNLYRFILLYLIVRNSINLMFVHEETINKYTNKIKEREYVVDYWCFGRD